MKLFRNRFILGGLCVAAAAVFSFIVLPSLYGTKEATVMVLRAAEYIETGKEIKDSDIELVEVGAYNLPNGTLSDESLAVGLYAVMPIAAGDFILDSKLQSEQFPSLMEQAMGEAKYLLTVTLTSTAAGVGGHLQAGDIVSIYSYMSESETLTEDQDGELFTEIIPSKVDLLIENIVLYAVENSNAEDVTAIANDGGLSSDKLVPKTATLVVTDEQAKMILMAEYTGKLHFVFVSRGAEK